ncbi:hypothetical protein [Janthinobacterium sp.]|uniref:hypothetical protein n=1 Tax=Janthinobacterium sp. TaxID=1871054 RepID=UPI00293D5FC9|nr:hypothetical protein [Janthinobacterium sp.]
MAKESSHCIGGAAGMAKPRGALPDMAGEVCAIAYRGGIKARPAGGRADRKGFLCLIKPGVGGRANLTSVNDNDSCYELQGTNDLFLEIFQ